MAKQVARVGDSVQYVCRRGDNTYSGVGRISTGSSNDSCDGRRLARDGDQADCGPCGTGIIQATARHRGNGRRIARINDSVRIVAGSARIISGSSRTRSD